MCFLKKHAENCEFKRVLCECGEKIQKDKLADHKENNCPLRKIICKKCEKSILWSQKEIHDEQECPKASIQCNLCSEKVAREKVSLKRYILQEIGFFLYDKTF